MYSAYYKNANEDPVCFYDNSVSGFGINGANHALTLIDPVLALEDSLAGEFNFTITQDNLAYDKIEKLTTVIEVWKNGSVYWRGRVTEQSSDFFKQISMHAEGSMAYLNDSFAPYKVYNNIPVDEYFKNLIRNHNRIMEEKGDNDKIINIGNVTVTGNVARKVTNYENTMTLVQELLDNYGGHLQMIYDHDGYQAINWLADYPRQSTQAIQFRTNLMDYTSQFDESDFCTAVIPLGEKIKRTMGPEFFTKGWIDEGNGAEVPNDTTMRVNHYITYLGNGGSIRIEVRTKKIECEQMSIKLYMYEYDNRVLKKVSERYFTDKINDAFVFEVPFDIYSEIKGTPAFRFVMMFDGQVLPDDMISNVYVYSDEEKLNLCPIQNGIPYVVNEDTLPYHGWICKKVDFAGFKNESNYIHDVYPLLDLAKEYLTQTQFNNITIEITAFDLSILNPKKPIDIPINKNRRYITSDGKYLVTADGQYYILKGGDEE